MVLDTESKLMRIIQRQVNEIENRFKMKIDWKREPGKACLSHNGKDALLFDQGKEEFITLYQKEFQDVQEKDFPIDTVKNIEDIDSTVKELMQEFAVVIERKGDKNVHIFGKENHVTQVMQRLQGKFGKRRTRRAYKETINGELPTRNTHERATMQPLSKTLENGVVVSVHQGDITRVQVDVIVNEANEHLHHGRGVAGAIVKQSGRQVQYESDVLVRRYGCFPVGQVAHTGPGNLPYKRIFHAVGPQWRVHGEERSRKFIFEACVNSFNMASQHKTSSIALPGISSGIYGVPKQICAEMMFTAAESFAAEASSDNQLKDIRFVNIDTPTYEAFRREFRNRYDSRKGKDVDDESISSQGNAVHYDAEKGRKYQRESNQGLGSAAKTSQSVTVEESERKKRADAAARRVGQNKGIETAKSEENLTEHGTLTNNVQNEHKSNFIDGFDKRESEVSRCKDDEGKRQPRKKEKEKEKEKEDEDEEKKEKKEEKDEKEKLEAEKRKENENEDKVYSKDNMQNQSVQGKEEEDLSDRLASLAINDDHKKDDSETPRKTENSEVIKEGIPKEVSCGQTNKNLSGNEVRTSDRKFSGRGVRKVTPELLENKTRMPCGRGRGALGHHHFAPQFPASIPGHVVREDSTNFKADLDNSSPESDDELPPPPGLTVSEEGLDLAKTTRKEKEETRKKPLESEVKDEVPFKKAKVDEGSREKNGEGSTKEAEIVEKDTEDGNQTSDKNENGDDKKIKEVKEMVKAESSVSENDNNSNEENYGDKNANRNKTFVNEKREESKAERDENSAASAEANEAKNAMDFNVQSGGDDGRSHGDAKAKGKNNVAPAEAIEDKRTMNPKDERVGNSQHSDGDTKNRYSAVSAKPIKPKESMDSQFAAEGDGQISDEKAKDKNSERSTESEKSLDSKGKLLEHSEGFHKDVNDESNPASAETTEQPKKSKDSKVELEVVDKSSGEDAKEGNTSPTEKSVSNTKSDDDFQKAVAENNAVPAEGETLDSNCKSEIQSSEQVTKESNEGDQIFVEGSKEVGETDSVEANDPNDISDVSGEPSSMDSFVVLGVPSLDHENPTKADRISGSSGESSDSIELLEYPDRDEFPGPLPSSPVSEQGDAPTKAFVHDINRSKMQSMTPSGDDSGQVTKQDERKTPLDLSMAEKKEKKEEDAGTRGSADIKCNGIENTNQDEETANETPSTEKLSRDEEADSMKKADGPDTSVSTSKEYQDCRLCYERIDLARALKICDHLICENCVSALKKNELSNTCPICHKVAQIATQPLNGQMKSGVIEGSLPGHEGCATLYIDYDFPEGIQGPLHPNPGSPYDELSRRTFLPDNEEGKEVLELLQKAFDACVLFTVGKSTITEKDNQIIFNKDIEQKINVKGGPSVSGYPDPGYPDRVKKQLNAKGIE